MRSARCIDVMCERLCTRHKHTLQHCPAKGRKMHEKHAFLASSYSIIFLSSAMLCFDILLFDRLLQAEDISARVRECFVL